MIELGVGVRSVKSLFNDLSTRLVFFPLGKSLKSHIRDTSVALIKSLFLEEIKTIDNSEVQDYL